MVEREEAAEMPPRFAQSLAGRSYGAVSPAVKTRRRKRRNPGQRRSAGSPQIFSEQHPYFSLSPQALRRESEQLYQLGDQARPWGSASALPQDSDTVRLLRHSDVATATDDDDDEDSHSNETSSDEESPPIIELIYRRTCKDKVKLIVIPLLYFLFFAIAGVFAFYSIEALIESYDHRVRTASYITVDNYTAIGIAIFPQEFATYENCQFKYADDLSPHSGNWTPLLPVNDNCSTFINVTFLSKLVNENRTAMVFRGPTRVKLKQSLWLNFSINMTKREFGAIEFLLLTSWDDLVSMNSSERSNHLADEETKEPLYTVPAGFRSWVKIHKIIRRDGGSRTNLSDFYLNTDFSKYSDTRPVENRTTDPLVVLFEWKSPTYEFIEDILSTTIWNTLGSLAGVFVTLIKAGEYFYAWIKRMRRERRKKLIKLQEMEEERQRMMAEYELRREERKRQKQLTQSEEKLNIQD